MTTPTPPTLAEIEALLHAATPGPWRWDGNLNTKEVYLVAMAKGRPYVMDFVRWGMAGASPRFQVRDEDGFGVMTRIDEGLAVKEREYRGDIERIDHPDAALIAAAPEAIAHLLRLVRERDDEISNQRAEWATAMADIVRLREALRQWQLGVGDTEIELALKERDVRLAEIAEEAKDRPNGWYASDAVETLQRIHALATKETS